MIFYIFPFPLFLRLMMETNRSLQMQLNLNFPWFIFNPRHFTISRRQDSQVYHLYFYSCVSSTYTVSPQKRLPFGGSGSLRGGGGSRRFSSKADTVGYPLPVKFFIILSSNIQATSATDFSSSDISSWVARSWFLPSCLDVKPISHWMIGIQIDHLSSIW